MSELDPQFAHGLPKAFTVDTFQMMLEAGSVNLAAPRNNIGLRVRSGTLKFINEGGRGLREGTPPLAPPFINYFNCGNTIKSREAFDFNVTKFSDIVNEIIPFVKKYPVVGIKSKDFED